MAKFKYKSIHPCHLTLKVNDQHTEFSLYQDEVYELPEDNSVVIRMQAQGLLEATGPFFDANGTLNTQLKNKKSNGS